MMECPKCDKNIIDPIIHGNSHNRIGSWKELGTKMILDLNCACGFRGHIEYNTDGVIKSGYFWPDYRKQERKELDKIQKGSR